MYTITDEDVIPLSQVIANTMITFGDNRASQETSKVAKNITIINKVREVIQEMGPNKDEKTIQPDPENGNQENTETGKGTENDKYKEDSEEGGKYEG